MTRGNVRRISVLSITRMVLSTQTTVRMFREGDETPQQS
jgi:hypothetical protein